MTKNTDDAQKYVRVTILLKEEAHAKLERIVEATTSSKNAIVVALLTEMGENEIAAWLRKAVDKGSVSPLNRRSERHRELLAQVSKLSAAQIEELLKAKNG